MRWPKYWSFSFNISLSNEHPGLISFKMDWLDLLAVQGALRSLSNTTVQKPQFFGAQPSLWSWYKPRQLRKVEGGAPVAPGLSQTDGRVVSGCRDRSPRFWHHRFRLQARSSPESVSALVGGRHPRAGLDCGALEAAREVCLQIIWFDKPKEEVRYKGTRELSAPQPQAGEGEWAGPRRRWRQPPTRKPGGGCWKRLVAGLPPPEGCVCGWPARLTDRIQ